MAGGVGQPAWRGYNAETLAEFLIGCMAFTTRIAHQDDVGADLHCVLKRLDSGMYIAEPYFFTVQVKKVPGRIIEYKKKHSKNWIMRQVNPFFVCLSDRTKLSISLYSTWNMHAGFLHYGHLIETVALQPGKVIDREHPYKFTRGRLVVPLGKPILTIKAKHMVLESKAMAYAKKLCEWIRLDQENIAHRDVHMYWFRSPGAYSTNGKFPNKNRAKLFYNVNNLHTSCLKNFGKAATHLRATIKRVVDLNPGEASTWSSQIQALDGALNSYYEYFEKDVQRVLSKIAGSKVNRRG